MSTARPRLTMLLFFYFVALAPSLAQSVDSQLREAAWRSYKLPPVEFTRYIAGDKSVLFRVPSTWQQTGYLQFKGPNDAELRLIVEPIADGLSLRSYTNAVLQNLRNLPGGADSLAVRRTEISSLEAREFLFNLADPRGRMTRRRRMTTSRTHADCPSSSGVR